MIAFPLLQTADVLCSTDGPDQFVRAPYAIKDTNLLCVASALSVSGFFAVGVIEAGTHRQAAPGSAGLLHEAGGVAGTRQHLRGYCEITYTKGRTRPWGPGMVEGSLVTVCMPQEVLTLGGRGASGSCVSGT